MASSPPNDHPCDPFSALHGSHSVPSFIDPAEMRRVLVAAGLGQLFEADAGGKPEKVFRLVRRSGKFEQEKQFS